MSNNWKSKNKHKYLLQYHLIFVCKYRKKLFLNQKSYITYHIWKHHKNYLSKHFWKENTFFTDGYFICSIGNISEKQLRKYIENQG